MGGGYRGGEEGLGGRRGIRRGSETCSTSCTRTSLVGGMRGRRGGGGNAQEGSCIVGGSLPLGPNGVWVNKLCDS